MATVYILYSENLDRFYIGSCKDFRIRLEQHLAKEFEDSYTCKADDWAVYFKRENLTYGVARKIEKHIKRMKSRKYYQNLRKYDDIMIKLIEKYREK